MEKRVSEAKELKAAWRSFIASGEIDGSVVRKEIAESWRRSLAYHVNPYQKELDFTLDLTEREKKDRFTRREDLLRLARPLLTDLYWRGGQQEVAIFLTDEEGFLLEVITTDNIWKLCNMTGALPGGSIHEKKIGTTAAGIVVATGEPAQVIEEEHFCVGAQAGFTYAAPVYDSEGLLYGVVEISGYSESALKHPHTFGMVVAAARAIEKQLHLSRESEKTALSNECLNAVINQMSKGLMIFDKEGRLTHMNPMVKALLSLEEKTALGQSFHEILPDTSLLNLLESKHDHVEKEIILEGGPKRSRCIVTVQKIIRADGRHVGRYMAIEEMKEVKRLVQRFIGATAQYNFSDILGESQAIKEVIRQGLTASKSVSNVLILGESGTGKEMVSQSIHNASRRRKGPFVALNCAALPSNLIESELFGYEEGTFTGAAKKGRPGKFELADEGTLFFDEIDKMPLEMQVKLLRVLEDKRILRLGGSQYLPVDVRIIAAANASLKDLMRRGIFREDLYYRLNVLQITIPPLRERTEDIPLLVDFFVREKGQRLEKTIKNIEKSALDYLCSLDWPGNVRQLENHVERAIHFANKDILSFSDFIALQDQTLPGQTVTGGAATGGAGDVSCLPQPQDKNIAETANALVSKPTQLAGGNLGRIGILLDQEMRHCTKMKNSLWLFVYLVRNADPEKGILQRKINTICSDMDLKRDTVLRWLNLLRKNGYIATKNTGRFLSIQIKNWESLPEYLNLKH